MGRPRRNPDDEVMVARETGVVNLDGQEIILKRGVTRAHRGHRIVEVYPTFWEPIGVHFRVEQMTAAPGESRVA